MTWRSDKGRSCIDILISRVFRLAASDEDNLLLLVLGSISAVLPFGFGDASLAATSHDKGRNSMLLDVRTE